MSGVRRRYWVEIAVSAVAAVLLVLTLITREWIEVLTGVDPDGGSGTLEWALVAGFGVVAVGGIVAAVMERRRVVPAMS